MKIHNRHLPIAAETTLDMIGVRRFNGEGGDGGGSGGSGGSGTGSGGQGGNSGATGGQGDGGNTGDRGGAGGGNGTASGGQGSGNGGSGSGGSGGSQNGNGGQGNDDAERRIETLPKWAQDHIREIRDEAAGNRTKRTAAEAQMTDLQRKVAVAFGIDVDGDGKPDPDKLAADLTAAQDIARMRSVELAVYRAAGDKNAEPAALLDSRTFLDSVADLDPSAQDFQTRLGDKITAAIQNNPRLAAGGSNTGGRPGGGIGQGGRGQQSGPVGVAAGRALHQERKGNRQNANSTT